MRAIGMPWLAGFYLTMAGVAFLALWYRDGLSLLVPPAELVSWLLCIGIGLGTGIILVGLSRAATAIFTWADALAVELRAVLGQLTHREILAAALLSGIGEEVLFRGVLQPVLGLWIATAVFGVLHIGPNRRFIPWTFMAFGVGLVLGLMFEWTGNLLAPILAHISINYLNLRYLSLARDGDEVHLDPVGGERAAGGF